MCVNIKCCREFNYKQKKKRQFPSLLAIAHVTAVQHGDRFMTDRLLITVSSAGVMDERCAPPRTGAVHNRKDVIEKSIEYFTETH